MTQATDIETLEAHLEQVNGALPELRERSKTAAAALKEAKAELAKDKENDLVKAIMDQRTEEKAVIDDELKKAREFAKDVREKLKAAKDATKVERVRQNGVLHPKPDSKCGLAWSIFDEISAEKGSPALISEAIQRAEEINAASMGSSGEEIHAISNVRAEYAQWRKFHDIPPMGRAPRPAPQPAPEAENAEATIE